MLLTSSLRRAAQTRPRGLACTGERPLTWEALARRIARLAGGLHAMGVAPGDRLAVMSLNRPEFLEIQYAALWAGCVLVPVNHRLAPSEIACVLKDCGAAWMAVDRDSAGLLSSLPREVLPEHLIALQEETPDCGVPLSPLERLADAKPIADQSGNTLDGLAAIFYTGGTTGRPKGVMLSHAALGFQAATMMQALALRADSVYLHATPMFHLADYGIGLAVTLAAGTHAFLPRFTPSAALQHIVRDAVTEVNLVPTMLAAMLDEATPADLLALGRLRTIAYGAAPMPEPLLDRLMQSLPHTGLRQFYGMTELCGACTSLGPQWHVTQGEHAGKLRTAGQALPFMEIAIMDADAKPVECGVAGEIVVRGPQVMLGYWGNPAASSAALREGWLHTGDVGSLDEDGFVRVVDRLKDMIVSGGENVYSSEVEDVLLAHPDVAACAVIGLPDARWGERVHAIVVLRPDGALDQDALDAYCRGRIAGYKRPRSYELRVEPLPVNGAGKVQKALLRQQALAMKPVSTQG